LSGSRYTVRVTKDFLVFSSGHFITYDGDHCEPVHGHNYRTAVEVDGELDNNHYVFDFIALRDMTKSIVDGLDHRMLLPGSSPLIRLHDDGTNWLVRYKERYWSFPKDECVVLPVANTTAELVADQIRIKLCEAIVARGMSLPVRMRIEVEECFGQSAEVEWTRDEANAR
jgi:6-pyruvoyltetrahydropterin/6-carboxytetrahydropterin synthase